MLWEENSKRWLHNSPWEGGCLWSTKNCVSHFNWKDYSQGSAQINQRTNLNEEKKRII